MNLMGDLAFAIVVILNLFNLVLNYCGNVRVREVGFELWAIQRMNRIVPEKCGTFVVEITGEAGFQVFVYFWMCKKCSLSSTIFQAPTAFDSICAEEKTVSSKQATQP